MRHDWMTYLVCVCHCQTLAGGCWYSIECPNGHYLPLCKLGICKADLHTCTWEVCSAGNTCAASVFRVFRPQFASNFYRRPFWTRGRRFSVSWWVMVRRWQGDGNVILSSMLFCVRSGLRVSEEVACMDRPKRWHNLVTLWYLRKRQTYLPRCHCLPAFTSWQLRTATCVHLFALGPSFSSSPSLFSRLSFLRENPSLLILTNQFRDLPFDSAMSDSPKSLLPS